MLCQKSQHAGQTVRVQDHRRPQYHGKPLRKSFYSTVSLSDAKKKAEEYLCSLEVSARLFGEAFVPSANALLLGFESGCCL